MQIILKAAITPYEQIELKDPLTSSTEQTVQNINFTQNTFYGKFSDAPAISTEAAALQQSVSGFAALGHANDRQNMADLVISAWANASSLAEATVRNPVTKGPRTFFNDSPARAITTFATAYPALCCQLCARKRFNGVRGRAKSRTTGHRALN